MAINMQQGLGSANTKKTRVSGINIICQVLPAGSTLYHTQIVTALQGKGLQSKLQI